MKEYTITSNDADQRLDKFLKKLFPEASLSFLYSSNRKGKIKVVSQSQLSLNSLPLQGKEATEKKIKGKKQNIEYKLQAGEIVQIYLSDNEIEKISQKQEEKNFVEVDCNRPLQKKDIVFEDANILVLSKNAGQNVHPGDHKTTEVSLIDQVHDYYQNTLDSLTFKPSLAHRIDRDTSGILMIGKTKKTLTQLVADFKSHKKIQKTYFCLVLGKVSRNSGTIRKKLKRIENAQRENKVQVSDSGQEAITHYKVIDEYTLKLPQGEQILSTLEVTIETGRMHQIRVHLQTLGNPILGDKAYGDKKLNSYFAKNYGITRQMLHAWKIQFLHPITSKKMKLEASLKKDMMKFIEKIK
ncbi:RluA family pseudouridine synthase [Candidatus Gracilibacteria bacterium]|nr:RluA family pseudouridine synthase [Candidatus Gracilibacteria bacterium]